MKSAEAEAAPTKKSFTYNLYRGRLFRLLKSSSTNSKKVAAILAKFPELVNERDRNGDTPLHLALMQSKGEPNKSVSAILDHATAENLRTRNNRDLTPTNLVIAYKLMSLEVTKTDIVSAIDVNPQLLNFKDRNKKSLFADDLKKNKGFTDKDVYHAYKAKAMLEAGKYTELGDFLSKLPTKDLKCLEFVDSQGEKLFAKELKQNEGLSASDIGNAYKAKAMLEKREFAKLGAFLATLSPKDSKCLEFVDSNGEKLFAKELKQNKGLTVEDIRKGYESISGVNNGSIAAILNNMKQRPEIIHFADRDGNSFAHHVIMSEHLSADKIVASLRLLKENGVDLNKQNAKGETILHTLAKSGKYSQKLFDKICNELEATPTIQNREGQSAITLKKDRNVEIAEAQSHEAAKASGHRFAYNAAKTKEQHQGGTPAHVGQPKKMEATPKEKLQAVPAQLEEISADLANIRVGRQTSSYASKPRMQSGEEVAAPKPDPAAKVKKPSNFRKLKTFLGFSSAKSTSIPYKYPTEHNRKGEIGYRSKSGDTRIL